jgi:hypothetical protein
MSETFTHWAKRAVKQAAHGRLTLEEAIAEVRPLISPKGDGIVLSTESLTVKDYCDDRHRGRGHSSP